MAVRDSEDAAKALGIDVLRVKLVAIAMSAALMAAAGVFYTQYLQYLDPHIAYGPAFSVAALVGAVIGGTATVFGPLLGAVALQLFNGLTRNALGDVPGVSPRRQLPAVRAGCGLHPVQAHRYYAMAIYQKASGIDSTGRGAIAAINGVRPSADDSQAVLRVGLRHKF